MPFQQTWAWYIRRTESEAGMKYTGRKLIQNKRVWGEKMTHIKFEGPGEEFGFYSKGNGEPLEHLKQRRGMIWFAVSWTGLYWALNLVLFLFEQKSFSSHRYKLWKPHRFKVIDNRSVRLWGRQIGKDSQPCALQLRGHVTMKTFLTLLRPWWLHSVFTWGSMP